MRIDAFLGHHGVITNPFADEDAQSDHVFKKSCIHGTYHPAWDKIYGDPSDPAASVVFGEKGSGKTALRLQIAERLRMYNEDHAGRQVFTIEYDDFNPPLERFAQHYSGRRRQPPKLLDRWRLWDHHDAILSLGVTQLLDRALDAASARSYPAVTDAPIDLKRLSPPQARDLLLLAALYDQSTGESPEFRWNRLRREMRFSTWKSRIRLIGAIAGTILILLFLFSIDKLSWLFTVWPYLAVVGCWIPWAWRHFKFWRTSRRIVRSAKTVNLDRARLRRTLYQFPGDMLADQPLPEAARSDDRYELLRKFQDILRTLGFDGLVVLVDRVDEPYMINGQTPLMKKLIWPMLDNKFLKHPALGVKLLLPAELEPEIDRENRDFHQRSRLDKQNLIRSLAWTGESLYDLAGARLAACTSGEQRPQLSDLFDPSVGRRRLVDALQTLRVPRHVFKFLYRLITEHCNTHSDDSPVVTISSEMFEAQLAVYQKDQRAFDMGYGAG